MKKPENNTENKKPTLNWIDDQFAVSGVRNYSDSCCFFNLYIKSAVGSVAIYGCKVVSGKNGDFIAFPSSAYESDGKKGYKDHASVIFDNGMSSKIIKAVGEAIK